MSQEQGERSPKYYVTTRGKKLKLVGVSPLLISKVQNGVTIPPRPTRKLATDIEGYEEEEELTADTLQNDEERAQWAAYRAELEKALSDRHSKFMQLIFAEGVDLELSDLEQWKEKQEYYGLEVPSHPIAQKVEYIQNEAIGSVEDLMDIITGVLEQTGIPETEMKSIEGMFRGALRFGTAEQAAPAEEQVGV